LQLGGVEWRGVAVNIVLAFFYGLACVPLALLSGGLYLLLRRFDGVTLGPLGHWEWWFLAALVFWVALAAWLTYASGRLSLATALSAERERISPFVGWPLTEGFGRTIVTTFVLVHIPAFAVWLALLVFGWVEPSDVPLGLHGPWPMAESIGAGVLTGAVLCVLQAPLSVGLLTFFYDMLAPLKEEAVAVGSTVSDETPVDTEAADDGVADGPEPEPEPEPEPDPPFSIVEFFPHIGRFSRISAPWLADEPVPEPYRYLAGLDAPAAADEEPEAAPPEPETYPYSVVEYSPHSGRFSRLFAPWLAHEEDGDGGGDVATKEMETETVSAPQPHILEPLEVAEPHAAAAEFEPTAAESEPVAPEPEPTALDGVGEAEHAKP
jgi:hypothetical protein